MSNAIVQQEFRVLDQTLALRHQLMELLTDADLSQSLAGNKTAGEQCREMVEVEHIYIESFKTFTHDYSYQSPDAAKLESSVDALKQTFSEQEAALKATLTALSPEDIDTKLIDRGPDFKVPVRVQFHIYREALLIFYAKISLYLRALNKDLPQQWQQWIG